MWKQALELLIEKGASTEAEDSEATAGRSRRAGGPLELCAAHPHARLHVVQKAAVGYGAERRRCGGTLGRADGASETVPLAVELRSGPLACRDVWSRDAVCVLLGGPSLIARYGWHVGLGCSVVSAFSFAFLAPETPHAALRPLRLRCWRYCVVRSFFRGGRRSGLVVLYAVLVSCLIGALAMTALSDPGMQPRPFLRVVGVVSTQHRRRRVGRVGPDAIGAPPRAAVTPHRRSAPAHFHSGQDRRSSEARPLSEKTFCPTCLIQRPARAKHDPTLKDACGLTTCPFVATVVGERNYRYFMRSWCFVSWRYRCALLVLPLVRLC